MTIMDSICFIVWSATPTTMRRAVPPKYTPWMFVALATRLGKTAMNARKNAPASVMRVST